MRRQHLIETTTRHANSVIPFMKEIGTDALKALNMITYAMDKKGRTNYSERVARYREYLEENDLSMSGAVTDVKGNRSLRPSEQEMPYYYLKVVERKPDGVIVDGLQSPHYFCAYYQRVTRSPDKGDDRGGKDYCVAFGIPVNTRGVKIISRPERGDLNWFDYPVSSGHVTLEAMTIFENVFVPAETDIHGRGVGVRRGTWQTVLRPGTGSRASRTNIPLRTCLLGLRH